MKTIFIFFISFSFVSFGQKQANVWYFGDKAGVNFNTNPPSALLNGQTDFLSPIGWNESYSSISDSTGALLFYCSGTTAWNKFQTVMPNGNGLLGHRSSSRGCLIVPRPNSQRLFYVFTNDALENNFQNGLRFSIVDMCLDGGKGDIISASKNTLIYPSASERLVGVRHSNGIDYWIISHKSNSNEFCAFLLTSSGITSSVTSNAGPIDGTGWGEMTISNNGQKISYCMPTAVSTEVTSFFADFNTSTGIVSNAQILSYGGREYATAFSPDNTKLYFSTTGIGNLFQYDLNAGNLSAIVASKNFLFQNGIDQWRHMALGPDGKIYISRAGQTYLSAINNPNNLFPGCTYVNVAINLSGKFTSHGLPNFITAFQYSNTIVPDCKLTTGIQSISENAEENIIYPNPNRGAFEIYVTNQFINGQFVLINVLGQKVYEQKIIQGANEIRANELPVGLYTYILILDNEPIKKGKLVIE